MGKTKLTKEIIRKKSDIQPWFNVYHLDTKKRGDFSASDGTMYQGDIVPPAFTSGGNHMVWQPYEDHKERYSKFFMNILNAGVPALVDIDECINMVFGGTDNIPRGLKILLAQGRLPGIHVYGGTQEVARSPRQMHSQAFHVISFNVINEYDERMMLQMLRLKERGQNKLGLKRFQFYHIRPDIDDHATLFNSYQEFVDKII